MRRADRPEPHIVWLYGAMDQNTTINRWLVNTWATSSRDPIRTFGDVFAPTPADVCAVIHALGPGVVVHTNADNVPAALAEQCGETEDFRVVTGLVP